VRRCSKCEETVTTHGKASQSKTRASTWKARLKKNTPTINQQGAGAVLNHDGEKIGRIKIVIPTTNQSYENKCQHIDHSISHSANNNSRRVAWSTTNSIPKKPDPSKPNPARISRSRSPPSRQITTPDPIQSPHTAKQGTHPTKRNKGIERTHTARSACFPAFQ
jgi:hypothetical protein